MTMSRNKTCGNSLYFDVLKASEIFDRVEAVINDKFISVSISQSVTKSSLNSGATSKILTIRKSFFKATF